MGQEVYFFAGLLPADEVPVIVPFMHTRNVAFFDIHILMVDSRDWILFLDISLEAEGQFTTVLRMTSLE